MKVKAQTEPLTQRQLFSMKSTTLEQKIISYFQHTKDTASVIEYLVVVMLRNALICGDYSFLCRELVCDLFMTAAPSDVLRKYCSYFKDYFEKGGQWEKVIGRLFSNKKEYYRFSEETRLYKKLLDTPGTRAWKHSELDLRLVSVFEDATGKKHTLTIRDADETRTKAEVAEILEILTTLSIFKKADGVRRFVKFVKVARPGTKDTFEEEVLQEVAQQEETVEESAQISEAEETTVETLKIIAPAGVDPSKLSEAEVLALVQVVRPEVRSLADIRVVFVEEEEEPPIEQAEIQRRLAGTASSSVVPHPQTRNQGQLPKESNTNGLADPLKSTKQRHRPLTNKQAYVQDLINKWKQ